MLHFRMGILPVVLLVVASLIKSGDETSIPLARKEEDDNYE